MSHFAQNLAGLPAADHLAAIELTRVDGGLERIENQPGSQGSLRVYAYLAGKYGEIDRAAAEEGIILFAEHGADALANPGKHPNIDRLLAIVAGGPAWRARLLTA